MELILWRHAEAVHELPDLNRALNGKGRKQASKIADWLDANLPDSCRILVSPATRCVQTAEALKRKFRIHPDLAPGATPEKILLAANWPNSREPVLIIGHQPTLGQVASILLTGQQQDWRIRRGNVWWISQRERDGMIGNYLRAAMAPDLIPVRK